MELGNKLACSRKFRIEESSPASVSRVMQHPSTLLNGVLTYHHSLRAWQFQCFLRKNNVLSAMKRPGRECKKIGRTGHVLLSVFGRGLGGILRFFCGQRIAEWLLFLLNISGQADYSLAASYSHADVSTRKRLWVTGCPEFEHTVRQGRCSTTALCSTAKLQVLTQKQLGKKQARFCLPSVSLYYIV